MGLLNADEQYKNLNNMDNYKDQQGKFIFSRLRDASLRNENLRTIQEMTSSSYLGDYISVCKILGRFYCFIDTRDRLLGVQLLTKGYWEIQNTECIAKRVKKDMTVIDIGANLGYFTLLMCGLVGNSKGKVYSIEANPYVFQLLSDSVAVNGQLSKVKLLNNAIYKEECLDLQFTFGDHGSTNGRIKSLKANPEKFNIDEKMLKVKGNTLDNLIPKHEKIDFIKVDIEGAEEMFWYGSKRIREDNDDLQILLEYNPNRYDDPKRFVNSIIDEGYQIKLVGKSEEFDQALSAEELLSIPARTHAMLLLEKT